MAMFRQPELPTLFKNAEVSIIMLINVTFVEGGTLEDPSVARPFIIFEPPLLF
jgi:hypothetical protein